MELPDITMTPKPFFELLYGRTKSWLLITAVEFKVFNLTVEKKTAPDIAASLKTHMDCIAITQRSASLKGVVFDKPAVIKRTREIIAEYEMKDRVIVMEGDYTIRPHWQRL